MPSTIQVPVNTSHKFHLGIEHFPGRRQGEQVALKLIFPTDLSFVLSISNKMRTPDGDIHRGYVGAETLNALLCCHFEKRGRK